MEKQLEMVEVVVVKVVVVATVAMTSKQEQLLGAVGRTARGSVRYRVPQTGRQRFVDSSEAGKDDLHLADQLSMN